ncbi:MAG: hypothetical protein KJ658_08015 [Proteobacteria bacterium]|nr:hypothetical protein [Desulfobacula sp.]MBU3952071.1 hypothetical protein [Pseudomonadota bacterium]
MRQHEIDKERLYSNRKEFIFYALNRNFEWSKKTNEIALQVRKWGIAFCLIFFGFLVKENDITVKWYHFIIGISGICFFMSLDVLQQYYNAILNQHRLKLNQLMHNLPWMTVDELKKASPVEIIITWNRWEKLKVFSLKLLNESILYFYGGLIILTISLLSSLKFFSG